MLYLKKEIMERVKQSIQRQKTFTVRVPGENNKKNEKKNKEMERRRGPVLKYYH